MKHQLGQPSRATWLSHPLNFITWVPPARPLAPVLPLPSPTALGRSYWESTPAHTQAPSVATLTGASRCRFRTGQ